MIAGEELTDLLQALGIEELSKVLSDGFCENCQSLLQSRLQDLLKNRKSIEMSGTTDNTETSTEFQSANSSPLHCSEIGSESVNRKKWSSIALGTPESVSSRKRRELIANSSPASVNSRNPPPINHPGSTRLLNNGLAAAGIPLVVDNGLAEVGNERIRIGEVGRKQDFVHIERVNGRPVNIVQGLELHTRVFNAEEQKKIVECVYKLQRMGQRGELRERTYTEPSKWMRGKGRVTIQFGCCYNYAVDKKGNPPGILRDEEVDPLPPLFKQMIKRMIRWKVLPTTCIPNSCIVNIYDEGDCIPPHIDHHDFLRPFCTVSFLTECNILFGANLKIVAPGEFDGPVSVPLPVGSVLILNGNGADIAKHCVPAVPTKRISITFRKMDEKKLPHSYVPDPELQAIKPFSLSESPVQQTRHDNTKSTHNHHGSSEESGASSYVVEKDDFPPLGGLNSGNRHRNNRNNPRQ